MAIGVTNRASGSGANASSFTPAAFTPAANSLLIACFSVARTASTIASAPACSDTSGLSWTQIADFSWVTASGSNRGRMTIFAAKAGASPASMTVTADYGANQPACRWSVFEVTGSDVVSSGVAGVILQTAHSTVNATGTALAGITLAAAGNAANRSFLFLDHSANEAITQESGWTQIGFGGNTASPAALAASSWNSTTFDASPTPSWTTSTNYGAIALEIKASTTPAVYSLAVATANYSFTAVPLNGLFHNRKFRVPMGNLAFTGNAIGFLFGNRFAIASAHYNYTASAIGFNSVITLPVFGCTYLTTSDTTGASNSRDYINNIGVNGCKAWINPHFALVNIRTIWGVIQPTSETSYYWDYLTAALTQAALHGKKISLVIPAGESVPDWVYGVGDGSDGKAKKFVTQTGESGNATIGYTAKFSTQPFPWDAYFRSKFKPFISALADFLAPYSDLIGFIVMSGWGRQAESFNTSYLNAGTDPLHGTGTAGVGDTIQFDAQAAADGYSHLVNPTGDATNPSKFGTHDSLAAWYFAAFDLIAHWMSEFPTTPLILDGGNPVPTKTSDTAGADVIAALSLSMDALYRPRFGFESDGLSQGYGAGNLGYNEVYRMRDTSVNGFQFTLPQQDDVPPGTTTGLTKFTNAVGIGVARGARYIQVYSGNAEDPTFASILDSTNADMASARSSGSAAAYTLSVATVNYSYALRPITAFRYSRKFPVVKATYSFAGSALNFGLRLPIGTANFSYNTSSISFGEAVILDTANCSFATRPVGFFLGRRLTIESTNYAYTANSLSLPGRRSLNIAPASFAFTGNGISKRQTHILSIDQAAFAFNASDVGIGKVRDYVRLDTANYGYGATPILFGVAMPIDTVAFAFDGNSVGLQWDSIPTPRLPGIPVAIPKGNYYITQQGDRWDLISLRVFGMQRGADHHADKLIAANPALSQFNELPGGLFVTVPELPIQTDIPLVPWKRTSVVTS